jgi:hypothetical protein
MPVGPQQGFGSSGGTIVGPRGGIRGDWKPDPPRWPSISAAAGSAPAAAAVAAKTIPTASCFRPINLPLSLHQPAGLVKTEVCNMIQ